MVSLAFSRLVENSLTSNKQSICWQQLVTPGSIKEFLGASFSVYQLQYLFILLEESFVFSRSSYYYLSSLFLFGQAQRCPLMVT